MSKHHTSSRAADSLGSVKPGGRGTPGPKVKKAKPRLSARERVLRELARKSR